MTRAQLDRLGDRLRAGSTERSDLIALAEYRNQFVAATDMVAETIDSLFTSFRADISQRPSKSTQSIVAKLKREHIRLTQMQDIGGVRIIVSKIALQDRVLTKLQAVFEDYRTVDRRNSPQFGYRAVHMIVKQDDCFIEIQVRTRLQNVWAQSSEKLADRFGQELKYGAGQPDVMGLLLASGRWQRHSRRSKSRSIRRNVWASMRSVEQVARALSRTRSKRSGVNIRSNGRLVAESGRSLCGS